MKRKIFILAVAAVALAGIWVPSARADRYDDEITRAYQDLLGRKPDPAGLTRYHIKMIDEGWSQEDVRRDIRSSQEYRSKGVDEVINRAYQDLLGRRADSSGFNFYKKKMVEDGWSERDVRNGIRESEEYKKKNP